MKARTVAAYLFFTLLIISPAVAQDTANPFADFMEGLTGGSGKAVLGGACSVGVYFGSRLLRNRIKGKKRRWLLPLIGLAGGAGIAYGARKAGLPAAEELGAGWTEALGATISLGTQKLRDGARELSRGTEKPVDATEPFAVHPMYSVLTDEEKLDEKIAARVRELVSNREIRITPEMIRTEELPVEEQPDPTAQPKTETD